jgi:predicted PurR-regulated permease PerM
MMLMTAALFLVVEPLIGHVIEPMVYGRLTRLPKI